MTDLSTISPEDELDLSEFGLQPFDDDLLIVDARIEEGDKGKRWVIEMEPQTETEATEHLPNGLVRDSGFLSVAPDADYDDPKMLERIGVRSLTSYFVAVFGAKHGSIAALKGELVHADVEEDDRGYAQVRNVESAT